MCNYGKTLITNVAYNQNVISGNVIFIQVQNFFLYVGFIRTNMIIKVLILKLMYELYQ